jgi:hypothetical protein
MKQKILLSDFATLDFQTPAENSFKFGYYNYCPLNITGKKLLAHKTYFEGRMPNGSDVVDIGYFAYPQGDFIKVAESKAFNWQQGSMLQWLGPDYDHSIIFNDVEGNNYVSRIIDLRTKKKRTLPKAIYGVDPNGKFSISLNFERCYFTRAYSYAPIVNEKWNTRISADDGIIRIDLETGDYNTIIGLKDFLKNQNIADDGESMHWFEHIMMNPSGTRFSFYHRFGTKQSFSTQLYTADVNGNNIWKHPSQPSSSFSHLGWKSNNTYIVFTYPQTNLRRWYDTNVTENKKDKKSSLIRFIYKKFVKVIVPKKLIYFARGQMGYQLTEDQNRELKKISEGILKKDGHPSFTKNGRFMLTDTYADEEGYRHLILYDLKKNRVIPVGKFLSSFNNCGWRADLHPRFSFDERFVVIDSAHSGYHQLLVLKLNWENIINS